MDSTLVAAVSAILVAVAGGSLSAAVINRRQVARLTEAQAALTAAQVGGEHADVFQTLTTSAKVWLEQAYLDRQRAFEERDAAMTARDHAVTMWRAVERRFAVAMAYIRLLQDSMRYEGMEIPPRPEDLDG